MFITSFSYKYNGCGISNKYYIFTAHVQCYLHNSSYISNRQIHYAHKTFVNKLHLRGLPGVHAK